MFNFSALALPIIQAPMAGGINTPRLASEVANAGGVGSFGFAYSTPQKIADDLQATRQLTHGPVNANFFVFSPVTLPGDADVQHAVEAVARLPLAHGHNLTVPQAPFYPDLEAQLAPVWAHRPALLTFHLGIPPLHVIERAHALGIAVGMTATCVAEALAIESAGADFVVAQGIEAGGHRGVFEPAQADDQLSAIELTQRLARACRIPVVCAGAIMSGGDITRALQAGAVAAQLGTAFLCCEESGASPAHKDFVLRQAHRGSVFTTGFSGRPARGIDNEFIRRMQNQPTLPFPIQNTLTAPLRQLAAQLNDGEYQSLWAGQDYARSRAMPARALMQTLQAEMRA